MTQSWKPQTQLVRGGLNRSGFDETSEALFMTSGYVYPSAEIAEAAFKGEADHFIYSRFSNPTIAMFQDRLALLEGAETCAATATGMAAVQAALMCQLKAGDRIVASRALFGSCLHIINQIMPRFGVETVMVDPTDLDQWAEALAPGAQVVLLETPSNPTLEIIDLQAVCDLAHKAGAKVIVDNVFATPILQKPMAFGADIVVYSATKHIDGQGRCLGGAILCSQEFYDDHLQTFLRHTGPAISPFNAWVMLKGLETLDLRVQRHCTNAAAIADFLADHPLIERVMYPGRADHPQHALAQQQMQAGGPMVSFYLKGGKPEAFKFLNNLQLLDISNNLGDAKSLINHSATTTHQSLSDEERATLGITDALIRLSVGLEDVEDLIKDLDQALA